LQTQVEELQFFGFDKIISMKNAVINHISLLSEDNPDTIYNGIKTYTALQVPQIIATAAEHLYNLTDIEKNDIYNIVREHLELSAIARLI
jgi:hypothetical protein